MYRYSNENVSEPDKTVASDLYRGHRKNIFDGKKKHNKRLNEHLK